jgi:hypothetical protein
MSEFDSVTKSQILDILGQFFRSWHASSLNQHRNYRNIPFQRGSSFEANEIQGGVKATSPIFILGIDPALTNHRQQNATRGHIFVNNLAEVASELDAGHIHEYLVGAELRGEIIE